MEHAAVPAAFYSRAAERFVPSEATRGPWDPGAQHAGPPSALLGRAIERCQPREEMRVGRITFEILRPVPLAPLTAEARLARPDRSVELLEASLAGPDGEVMRARAWRLRARPERHRTVGRARAHRPRRPDAAGQGSRDRRGLSACPRHRKPFSSPAAPPESAGPPPSTWPGAE